MVIWKQFFITLAIKILIVNADDGKYYTYVHIHVLNTVKIIL